MKQVKMKLPVWVWVYILSILLDVAESRPDKGIVYRVAGMITKNLKKNRHVRGILTRLHIDRLKERDALVHELQRIANDDRGEVRHELTRLFVAAFLAFGFLYLAAHVVTFLIRGGS